ncbi:MAG: hypothetical protein Q7R86_02120 [bacterium]|nr:hypothetical protein [bacterium]
MQSRHNAKLPMTSKIFTKKDLQLHSKKSPHALDAEIKRALKNRKLIKLKRGLYTKTETYLNEPNKLQFAEFLASQIHSPSYLSLNYVLHKHGLMPNTEDASTYTSITPKNASENRNFLGTFRYSNLKKSLYHGFQEVTYDGHIYSVATKAKALFDYLYLEPKLQYRNQRKLKYNLFIKLRLNLENFSEKDFQEFEDYVWKSNCKKMMRIRHCLESHFANKKFDIWAKEFLKG